MLDPTELNHLERAAAYEAALAALPEMEARAVGRLSARLQELAKRPGRASIGPGMGLEIIAAVGIWLEENGKERGNGF